VALGQSSRQAGSARPFGLGSQSSRQSRWPMACLYPRRGSSLNVKYASFDVDRRLRCLIQQPPHWRSPFGERVLWDSPALSSFPGHTPTHEDRAFSDRNCAALGPTSAIICSAESTHGLPLQLLDVRLDRLQLTAPTFAMMPVFHEISRAEGPSQQTTKDDGLSHLLHESALAMPSEGLRPYPPGARQRAAGGLAICPTTAACYFSATTGFISCPRPSTSTTTLSPGFR
jgi:hypothetical protein